MTDEQIIAIADGLGFPSDDNEAITFARALFAASIADTAGAKPVAWANVSEDGVIVGLSQHPEDIERWQNPQSLVFAAPPVPSSDIAGAKDDATWANVRFVRDTFAKDLEQGFKTRDKTFAVDLLTRALNAAGTIDKKALAWDAHNTCAQIPGATHYNAAEIAIDAVLKALAAPPAPSVADAAGASEDARDAARYRKAVAIGWLNALVTENLDHMIAKDKE